MTYFEVKGELQAFLKISLSNTLYLQDKGYICYRSLYSYKPKITSILNINNRYYKQWKL